MVFRGYAYRMLANLFGGVPLILEEITTPRRDYVRASREEVYKQIKQDLEEAVSLLPNIESVKDGKLSKQVAQHLLAEVNICLGLYDEAIQAASAVIDHPEMALMTNRFGSRQNESRRCLLGSVPAEQSKTGVAVTKKVYGCCNMIT